MKLIGVGGTDGSGKDSLGHYLRDSFSWYFISVTDLLRIEAKKRGLPLSRGTLKEISIEWRAQSGLGVLVNRAVEDYKKQAGKFKGLVVVSLRNPGEVDRIHELGGKVIWLDAPIQIRYQRVVARNKSSEDQVSFKEFQAEEAAQMHHQGDEATLNLSGVKAKADVFITNDSDNIEEFKRSIDKILANLL